MKPPERWLDAIPVRRARRSYTPERPTDTRLAELERLCEAFSPFAGLARVTVIRQASQALFSGVAGSYGGISGAPCALAFIGDAHDPRATAAVGYTGEGVVLEATALGLETCWVGGLFSTKHAVLLGDVGETERVYAVSPLGHATETITVKERVVFRMGRPKFRRQSDEIAHDIESWPTWARAGVEAVRVAPSAMNRQPWRFRMEGDDVFVSAEGVDTPRVSKRLDCGIAMLHFELGARGAGVEGEWELLEASDVGRWRLAR